jgi:hypothetical protein
MASVLVRWSIRVSSAHTSTTTINDRRTPRITHLQPEILSWSYVLECHVKKHRDGGD